MSSSSVPITMQALYSSESTDPSAKTPFTLSLSSIPVPAELPTSHALIRIKAAGLNPSDALNAFQHPFPTAIKPQIMGRDFSGIIVSIANDASPPSDWKVGDEVYGTGADYLSFTSPGVHAEYVLVPFFALARKPENLSFEQAGVVGVPYTAALAALKRAGIASEKTVLIVGATGSVGKAAVNIARGVYGCRVITASRHDETDVNTTKDPGFEGVSRLTGGKGVDIALDVAGAKAGMEAAIKVLAVNGRYVFIAAGNGGTEVTFDARNLYRKNLGILGVMAVDIKEMTLLMGEMKGWFEEGKLQPPDEREFEKVNIEQALEKYPEVLKLAKKKWVIVFD